MSPVLSNFLYKREEEKRVRWSCSDRREDERSEGYITEFVVGVYEAFKKETIEKG